MRRSKSFSNIPMPLLNKRESKVLKRSKSTLRVSREPSLEGRTPLNNRAGTSVTPVGRSLWSDPKYKTTPYDRVTRTGSVSSFGSRVSTSKNRSPYEKRTSQQKLINDKKWVAEQYYKTGEQQLLVEESEQKLCQEISAGVGIDQEAAKSVEQPLKTFQITVSKLDSILEEIRDEIQALISQNLERREIIKRFKESNSTEEEDLVNELIKLNKLYSKLTENKQDLILSIQELKKVVDGQSCRFKEKKEILKKIEELQREIERKERKITEYMAVRAKLDYKLTNMVTQIEAKVDDWNVTITKSLLPEILPLKLREKGFHSKQFLEELEEITDKKVKLQKELLNECGHIVGKIEELRKESESYKKSYQEVVKTRNQLNLKELVQRLKDEHLSLVSSIEEVTKTNLANATDIEYTEGSKLKIEETELAVLEDGIQQVTVESEKAAKKGVSVLVEARNLAFKFMKKIDNNMESVLQDITEKADISRHNLMESYNYLLTLQQNAAENLEEENKENKENNSL